MGTVIQERIYRDRKLVAGVRQRFTEAEERIQGLIVTTKLPRVAFVAGGEVSHLQHEIGSQ